VEVIKMLVLITYDVNTQNKEGRKRLRHVAKQCVNYGVRVQNSVFECVLDAAKFRQLKQTLSEEIDPEKDSLRFYFLGDNYKTKVEHIGAKQTISVEEPLIF
jgi:CRISPR-associated protein Cas2